MSEVVADPKGVVVAFPLGIEFLEDHPLPSKFCIIRPGAEFGSPYTEGQRVNLWHRVHRDKPMKVLMGVAIIKMIIPTDFTRSLLHASHTNWAMHRGFLGETARAWVKEMYEDNFKSDPNRPNVPVTVMYLTTV